MEFVAPTEAIYYLVCHFCHTELAVRVPYKLMEMAKVKCGHCNNIFFSPITPMFQCLLPHENQMSSQRSCLTDCTRNHPLPAAASSASYEQTSPFVVKPPAKKPRQASAYNHFMREEIQRIKAAKPDIPHREAFSMAAKNWARSDRGLSADSSSNLNVAQRPVSLPIERDNGQRTENLVDVFKQIEHKGHVSRSID